MEDASKLNNIQVIVADRPYRLKIKPEEEEMVRKAAKLINEKIKSFQTTYQGKDKQDFLAMCALLFGVDALNFEQRMNQENDAVSSQLDELDDILSGFSAE